MIWTDFGPNRSEVMKKLAKFDKDTVFLVKKHIGIVNALQGFEDAKHYFMC